MASTIDQFSNFATSTVAGGAGGVGTSLLSTDATLHLAAGDGAKFPSSVPFSVLLGTTTGAHEIAQCSAISGDALTLTRGQEGTSAQTWAVGASVAQMVTAGNLTNLRNTIQQTRINVKDYGAKGDGTTDDTTAIQAAITAVQNAGGGVVFFPAGTCLISSTLTVSADNVQLVGAGWASILTPGGSFAASTPMIQVQAPGSGFRYGIKIADLYLNCNSQTGVGGIEGDSVYGMLIDHVRVRYCAATAIYFYSANTPQTAAYDTVRDCYITDGVGASAIGVLTNVAEWIRIENSFFSHYTTAGAICIKFQGLNCQCIGCSFDDNDTAVNLSFTGRAVVLGCQFDRGLTQFILLQGSDGSAIIGNALMSASGGSPQYCIRATSSGNHGNAIIGNTTMYASGWPLWYSESADVGGPGNVLTGNNVGGLGMSLVNGTARGNAGYNPRNSLQSPQAAPGLSDNATGGTIPAGVYQVEVTYLNIWGESKPSAAGSITLSGSTSTLTIASPAVMGDATGWYAYVTQAGAGTFYRQQTAGSPTALGASLTLTANPTTTGANPPGSNGTSPFTQPSVPSSGAVFQNTLGSDATVYLNGGTISQIQVGGTNIGITTTPLAVRVPAYASITINYTVAPTWVWVLD